MCSTMWKIESEKWKKVKKSDKKVEIKSDKKWQKKWNKKWKKSEIKSANSGKSLNNQTC